MSWYWAGSWTKLLHSGSVSRWDGPPGVLRWNCCTMDTRKSRSSIRARDSPTHARLPGTHTHKTYGLWFIILRLGWNKHNKCSLSHFHKTYLCNVHLNIEQSKIKYKYEKDVQLKSQVVVCSCCQYVSMKLVLRYADVWIIRFTGPQVDNPSAWERGCAAVHEQVGELWYSMYANNMHVVCK